MKTINTRILISRSVCIMLWLVYTAMCYYGLTDEQIRYAEWEVWGVYLLIIGSWLGITVFLASCIYTDYKDWKKDRIK